MHGKQIRTIALIFLLIAPTAPTIADDDGYRFDATKGICQKNGQEGRNANFWGECGELHGKTLKGKQWTSQTLLAMQFFTVNLDLSNFANSKISHTLFSKGTLSAASFHKATLDSVTFSASVLNGSNLSYAKLVQTSIANATGINPSFESATFIKSSLSDVDFKSANFSYSTNDHFSILESKLDHANFSRMVCADASTDKLGFWILNSQLNKSNWLDSDCQTLLLVNVNMSESSLQGANLSNCMVSGSNLQNLSAKFSNFSGCQFYGFTDDAGTLTPTNLDRAYLQKTKFNAATFSKDVILTEADIRNASFKKATFNGTDLSGIKYMNGASFFQAIFYKDLVLKKKTLRRISFRQAQVKGTLDFSESTLESVDLYGLFADKAIFKATSFHKINAWKLLFNHSDFKQASFESTLFSYVSFKKANFQETVFNSNARFYYSDLTDANFSNATFNASEFVFEGSDISGANFKGVTRFNRFTFHSARANSKTILPQAMMAVADEGETLQEVAKRYYKVKFE